MHTGIRACSPDAGATVWNIAAATTIIATTAKTVRNFVNVASISAHLLSCRRRASVRAQTGSVTASKRVANASDGPGRSPGSGCRGGGQTAVRFAIRIGNRATVRLPLTSEATTSTT